MDTNKIEMLNDFRIRDKFSVNAWHERGLNPSDEKLSQQMNSLFTHCADNLIIALKNKRSQIEISNILKSELKKFNNLDYDTEEGEFITDLFQEIASILEIDIRKDIGEWLYGSLASTLLKDFLSQPKKGAIETLSQPCTK